MRWFSSRYYRWIALLILVMAPSVFAAEGRILFREDFNGLEGWEEFLFPKIERHTSYTVEADGELRYLKAESNGSASAIVHRDEFNVYEYPVVRWRWKVDNVYRGGDALTKAGDDYPLRIYIMFKFDPEKAGLLERLKYGSARLIYGQYPPHSSINYIWANLEHGEDIITNSYAEQAEMVLLQKGGENVGKWVYEEVNIVEDYRRAFGSDPPAMARIAIMNDSDNTGESSISYVDYIEVLEGG